LGELDQLLPLYFLQHWVELQRSPPCSHPSEFEVIG
jgi:hypothetical protein